MIIQFPSWLERREANDILSMLRKANSLKYNVDLTIKSHGGSTEAGIEIAEFIRNSEIKVTAIAYGICDSAASFVFVSCHKRIVCPNATMIIHPQTIYINDARYDEFLQDIKMIKELRAKSVKLYSERTRLPKKLIRDLTLCKERKFNSIEMLHFGIADEMSQR
jgi:ATP-dependent protease ClpP protease subunit